MYTFIASTKFSISSIIFLLDFGLQKRNFFYDIPSVRRYTAFIFATVNYICCQPILAIGESIDARKRQTYMILTQITLNETGAKAYIYRIYTTIHTRKMSPALRV